MKLPSIIFQCNFLESNLKLLKTLIFMGMGVHIQYMPTNVVYEGYVHGYVLRCQDFIFSTYVLENDFDQKPHIVMGMLVLLSHIHGKTGPISNSLGLHILNAGIIYI